MELKPGYKQTEVGVIPEDWEVMTVGDIAIVGSGGTPNRKNPDFWGGDIPWITTTQIDGGEIKSAEQYITKSGFEGSAAKWYPRGTILLAMYGQGKTRGKTAVLGIDATINQACAAITVLNTINKKYLLHYLIGCYDTIRESSNSGGQENLNSNIVKSIKVIVPTKTEQTAIANALSDADALIQSLTSLIAKKRQIKQGAMQTLLNPYENGRLKEGWVMKKLGDCLDKIVGGGTPSRSVKSYWGKEIPWVTVKDFSSFNPFSTQEYITTEGLKHSATNIIPRGTIIIATRMALGRAVIYDVDVCINQDLKAIFPKLDVCVLYLKHWLEKNASLIEELGSGSTVMGVSLEDLRKIEFSMPSKENQTRIATILSDMDAEIAALEAKLTKYRHIKQGMMQNLLTGRIRLVQPDSNTGAAA